MVNFRSYRETISTMLQYNNFIKKFFSRMRIYITIVATTTTNKNKRVTATQVCQYNIYCQSKLHQQLFVYSQGYYIYIVN